MRKKKWTREKVIEVISELYSNNECLSGDYIKMNNRGLYNGAVRRIGNWRKAIELAGIEYESIQKYKPNEIKTVGDTKEVTVFSQNGDISVVIIDKDVTLPTSVHMRNGYGQMKINGSNIGVHQYIYGEVAEGNVVDHINQKRLDCRMVNLRELDYLGNAQNRKAKGYTLTKYGTYNAKICVNRKHINLGSFATEEEASKAYQEAKEKYHIGGQA